MGAPLGDAAFCEQVAAKRVAKVENLLRATGEYDNSQGALLVLRHCASWGKLVYSARTVPPALHRQALAECGIALRRCLETIVGDSLPERCWDLAQLGIIQGGLGIRDPARHAPAAYLASFSQTRELCGSIDSGYDPHDADGGSCLQTTEAELRASALDGVSWDRGAVKVSQKELSGLLDAAAHDRLLQAERHDASFTAHVALSRLPGAGAWLTAPPAEDGREIDAPLFQVAVKRRLRAPVFGEDGFCPCCGQVLDKWGDHALVCPCGGDRTIRHNAIRDVCYEETSRGGLRPEREKAGLLPGRPDLDGLPAVNSLRRPADVWLPRGLSGKGEALDFAVSSAMRGDLFRQAAESPDAVFQRYENLKRQYKDTDACCRAAGFLFVPMVLEAHAGSLSGTARGMLDWIARRAAAAEGEVFGTVSLKIAQRISCALHRENARAVLRRTSVPDEPKPASGWADPATVWQ